MSTRNLSKHQLILNQITTLIQLLQFRKKNINGPLKDVHLTFMLRNNLIKKSFYYVCNMQII